MPKNNTITVGISAHNEEQTITRCLESILSSNIKDKKLEIYVCLSACTDNTESVVKSFKTKHPKANISIVVSERKGKVLSYKKLDQTIKNEVIIFMDADCVVKNDTIYKIFDKIVKSPSNIKIVSSNTVDPRYVDKTKNPSSLIEAFNMVFWQHDPRRVVNGALFAARKGCVQIIKDDVKLDDIYLSLSYWDNLIKDNSATVICGSPQKMYEVVRYQRNIQAGKKQIENYLGGLENFNKISKELYDQFDIKYSNKDKYYPNVSYLYLFVIKLLIFLGQVWGQLGKASWNVTKGSKEILVPINS